MAGYLDEHDAPKVEKNAATYTPTPEEEKAIKLAERLFEKAKLHREKYDTEWVDYYHLYRGKQWKERRPTYRHSEVINLVFRSIESTVPIQMDVDPKIEFVAEEPGDREFAEIMNHVIASEWERNDWGNTVLEVVYDANLYGSGLSFQNFDPKADFGAGKLIYESADPMYSFPDPNSWNVNHRGCYFTYAEPLDVDVVKKKYPHVKEYIKSDLVDFGNDDRNYLKEIRYRSPVDQKLMVESTDNTNTELKNKVLVITTWILPEGTYDDFTEEEIEHTDAETGAVTKEYVQKAKYPKGRKIVVAGKVLCEDIENPFDDAEIPFAKYDNYILPREFWGQSEVQQLAGPQRAFNKMVSFVLDVLTITGNPIWLVPVGSQVNPDKLVNAPGATIPYAGDTPPTRQEGTQLQPYVLQMVDRMSQWFDTISGANDVTRGVRPEGVTAAKAIDALQDAAQTRLRGKSRRMDRYLAAVGRQLLSRVLQFYDAPRVVRLTNNQNATKYFKFTANRPTVDPQGNEMQTVSMVPLNDDGTEGFPQEMKVGKLDVRARTGSSLAFAQAQKKGEATQLFQLGLIDQEEVLKTYDWPNWQAVLQRVQEQQAAMAQAEAQQQGAPQ